MWTKLGDEWSDAARDLSDAAWRTHVEALGWSNRRGLDLRIPKRDLKRFAETEDPDTAVKELVAADWWRDDGEAWFLGLRFADWQLESSVLEHRREAVATRVRRHRLHEAGDHSECLPRYCPHARNALSDALPDGLHNGLPGTGRHGTGRVGTGRSAKHDPL